MRFVLLIILLLLVLGALPTWPYSAEWGYYPSSGLGLVLVVILLDLVGTDLRTTQFPMLPGAPACCEVCPCL